MLVARDGAKMVGLALGKASPLETKLRCVRVLPDYQNKGVGLHLIERMLKELDSEKPHCTVAEEIIHQYSRAFINHFDFDLTRVEKGRYRPGKLEYVFN
jgi:N-acetylglutamate synthase-like GNAT family acetyltransferase